ncbi:MULTISPECIES: cytochrome c [unclassified Yoonia]|uniref:c-type cytochrome n=1 Tax=unclassified Yoonia TaxID=2629118 RepID=UPI002AFE1100|nr:MULTISPECIES: cytochrome c [unclassified Yoonia]
MTTPQLYACFLFIATVAYGATSEAQAQEASDDPIAELLARFSEDEELFTQTSGEALYRTTCQACHMEAGEGAAGAGAYPPLAGNPKMNSKHFVAGVILNGYQGMPHFADEMDDAQVAAVTNYVRMELGNAYQDAITADQVAKLRPPDGGDSTDR